MAKPFRVKRGSKYIGSWKARVKGEIINLETQDADEARRRERRARAGDFGWQRATADAVKSTLDGDGPPVEVEGDESEPFSEAETPSSVGAVECGFAPAAPVAPAVAAAEGSAGATVPPSQPPVDPVAEVNAAAAGMVGEIRETLDAAGIDLAALMEPETLGGLHVAAQDMLFQVVAPLVTKRKPKPFELPEKFAGAVKVLGQAWQAQLQKWNLSLDGVSPGSLILLATGGMLVAQVVALYQPAAEQSAPDGAAGAV